MFEQTGCAWCEAFDREIAPIYPKTAEGQRAPLRRVNIDHALPSDLAFIKVERLAPLFVLVEKGQPIQAGDVVCILEAMKMENAIPAPREGVVSELPVQAGQIVEVGETIAVID